MTWTIPELFSHVMLSLARPRQAARQMMGWAVPDIAIGPLVVLSVVLLTLGAEVISALNPPPPEATVVYVAPIALAFMVLATIATLALMTSVIGRLFGGKGDFKRALLLITWVNFVGFWLLLPISLLSFLPQTLFDILLLSAVFYMLWVTVAFVTELHSFRSIALAFVVVLLATLPATLVYQSIIPLVAVIIPGEDASV